MNATNNNNKHLNVIDLLDLLTCSGHSVSIINLLPLLPAEKSAPTVQSCLMIAYTINIYKNRHIGNHLSFDGKHTIDIDI